MTYLFSFITFFPLLIYYIYYTSARCLFFSGLCSWGCREGHCKRCHGDSHHPKRWGPEEVGIVMEGMTVLNDVGGVIVVYIMPFGLFYALDRSFRQLQEHLWVPPEGHPESRWAQAEFQDTAAEHQVVGVRWLTAAKCTGRFLLSLSLQGIWWGTPL